MTNAEKYLKNGVDEKDFLCDYMDFKNDSALRFDINSLGLFLQAQVKPILTEEERTILRNVSEEYIKVGRTNEGLYFLTYRDCKPNTSYSYYVNVFKSSLFDFIQEGDEYVIKDLLGDE